MGSPAGKRITLSKRLLRASFGMLPGIALGLLFHFALGYAGSAWVIGILAGVIGAALSQPEVSTRNVLKGTAGTIVAYNVPRAMREPVMDWATKDSRESNSGAQTEVDAGTPPQSANNPEK